MTKPEILSPLPLEFYERSTDIVAKELLGKLLIRELKNSNKQIIISKIVEVEAYMGEGDPASHACNGPTPRSSIMFGRAGKAYVYLNYGVHNLLNIVTEIEGKAGAVLLRALEPVSGLEIMRLSRTVKKDIDLTNGPGKLTKAIGVTLDHNGLDMTDMSSGLYVAVGNCFSGIQPEIIDKYFEIEESGRIGISSGTEMQLRFTIKGNQYVSR